MRVMAASVAKTRAAFLGHPPPRAATEGPGDRASTTRALGLAAPLPKNPRGLDIACGPGAKTLDLAELLPDASICAIDNHQPFVDGINRRAATRRVSDRVRAVLCDMRMLRFPPAAFDLISCEGAAYIIGTGNALRNWRPLLKPGGKLAVSEPVWLTSDPPERLRHIWFSDYTDMGTVETCRAVVRDTGYRLLGDFVLPETAWWEYYTPLQQRLDLLSAKYAVDTGAATTLRAAIQEITTYREFGQCFT
jgi:SAM-dependent methyltransferase